MDALLRSGAHNYLECKLLRGPYLWQHGRLCPVPASKAEIFKVPFPPPSARPSLDLPPRFCPRSACFPVLSKILEEIRAYLRAISSHFYPPPCQGAGRDAKPQPRRLSGCDALPSLKDEHGFSWSDDSNMLQMHPLLPTHSSPQLSSPCLLEGQPRRPLPLRSSETSARDPPLPATVDVPSLSDRSFLVLTPSHPPLVHRLFTPLSPLLQSCRQCCLTPCPPNCRCQDRRLSPSDKRKLMRFVKEVLEAVDQPGGFQRPGDKFDDRPLAELLQQEVAEPSDSL